jgi:hypothetical protein
MDLKGIVANYRLGNYVTESQRTTWGRSRIATTHRVKVARNFSSASVTQNLSQAVLPNMSVIQERRLVVSNATMHNMKVDAKDAAKDKRRNKDQRRARHLTGPEESGVRL